MYQINSICCIPKIHTILYVNYISIKKERKKRPKLILARRERRNPCLWMLCVTTLGETLSLLRGGGCSAAGGMKVKEKDILGDLL